MKTKPSLPPACEWDFHRIDPQLLRTVAVYEYARTSEKVRTPLVRWLDTILNGQKVRQHIFNAILAANKCGRDVAECHPKGLWQQIYMSAPDQGVWALEVHSIIMETRPDFPVPWIADGVKISVERDLEFSRVRCTPLEYTFRRLAERDGGKIGLKRLLELEGQVAKRWGDYKLEIDWYAENELSTIAEIVGDFEKWLRAEVADKKPKMRTGRNAQAEQTAYPLKCLAALRLRQAGFTYEAAANALQRMQSSSWIIPFFKNAPSWTKAIQFAKKSLADIDAGKLNF